ncbi:MAG: phasin family protein [Geminicoccaceae bacterium]
MATGKIPGMFQPEALMEAQRRNMEAFTSAGRIVADGLRTAGERQIAHMQDAMRDLWGEMQLGATAKPAQPHEQMERMRGAFERVMSQVQELSGLLLKVQQEAMKVLNSAANANMKAFGAEMPEMPDLLALQKTASEAVQAATRQTASAVEEMRRRMTDLELETKKAAAAASPPPAAAPAKPAPAPAAPKRAEPPKSAAPAETKKPEEPKKPAAAKAPPRRSSKAAKE